MMQFSNIGSNDIRVIDSTIPLNRYVPIDLSISNLELQDYQLDNAADFERYINQILEKNSALVAYGGYNEQRNLYHTSTIFSDNDVAERDIHLGVDLWAPAGTSVLAAFDGTLHSFRNNIGKGNYGPTIIIEHSLANEKFYSLYGHLALDDIEALYVGLPVKQGERIATLGSAEVNGGYAPHLHFQIILNIGHYNGDYPGVCSAVERDHFLQNSPDPSELLNLKQ